MDKLCDLHVHSNYSDGTLSPKELVELAKQSNLSAIALTDHNTITGLESFLASAKDSGIEAIPGIEFSTHYLKKEYHIVALFIDKKHYDTITNLVQKYDDYKELNNLDLVKKLATIGMSIDYKKIKDKTLNSRLNRANIAAELVEQGYVGSIQEAFETVLSKEYGLYIEPETLETIQTIKFIKQIGAVAILAHPLFKHTQDDLEELLPQAKAAGLDGIEVYYSTFSEQDTILAKKIADKYGLLYSGGSDFHGKNKPDINLGIGKGNLKIDYSLLTNFKTLSKKQ